MGFAPGSAYFEVAKRLLEAPELSLGGHIVKRRSLPTDLQLIAGDNPSARWAYYSIETKPLNAPVTIENLLLFAGQVSREVMLKVWKATAAANERGRLLCVVPEDAGPFGSATPAEVTLWTANTLFDHMLKLPSDFPARLRDVAAIERPDEFPVAFQERRVRIYRYGEARRSPGGEDVLLYFRDWLKAHRRVSPMLLLGERGLGKSWQSLRLAQEAYELNKGEPWLYGPAFFVKLRELVNVLEESSAATPVLLEYILTRYPGLEVGPSGLASLGALMAIGHTVVCVDGFDEMDLVPSDAQVRARLTELLMLLSRKTRFIMSCRPGHFTSLEALLKAESWSGAPVGQAFEILDLLPYDDEGRWAYIEASAQTVRPVLAGLLGESTTRLPLQHALWVCATHPGLLARMKDRMLGGATDARRLIEDAITSILIEFNVAEGRTRAEYQAADGTWIDLSPRRRAEILADIAWYMGERNLEILDLSSLPPRIRLSYQIDDDALQRDLRSQTAFELAPLEETAAVRDDPEPVSGTARSLVRFTLRDEEWEHKEPGEVSVAWAYFIARHVTERMTEQGPLGEIPLETKLRYLGRIRFGPTVGLLVADLLAERGMTAGLIRRLGTNFMRSLALGGDYRLFSPWYKHLATNLAAMGVLDGEAAEQLSPWTPDVEEIVRAPRSLRDYAFAIVPPIGYQVDQAPFVLGIHEVTNQEYLAFIEGATPANDPALDGREWAVERMTVAAGRQGEALSANHALSNEYHLFFWLPTKGRGRGSSGASGHASTAQFRPPKWMLGRPVTYVSWFAAAAYCDWLSVGESLPRFYREALVSALGQSREAAAVDDALHGFRLPTKREWIWAARAGYGDVDRAWELYPFYLSRRDRARLATNAGGGVNEVAARRYRDMQNVMCEILLDPYKQSGDVLHDEPNDFGVAGLVGNVREWCDSAPSGRRAERESEPAQRLILGATGYLGESTFNFEYEAPLYPRNTNPDVGFRVARTLRLEEIKALRRREELIAALPED